MVDYRFLAKNAGLRISISSIYILFLTEMQKRQTLEKGICREHPQGAEREFNRTDEYSPLNFEGKLPGVVKEIRARPTGSTPVEIV
jgi:hypothetical protein